MMYSQGKTERKDKEGKKRNKRLEKVLEMKIKKTRLGSYLSMSNP